MTATPLFRWAMLYFWLALAALMLALGLMAGGIGYPAVGLRAPHTLLLVHLIVLGWLSLLMVGALFQFVPVLIAKPLRAPMLALPALPLLVGGLGLLALGFLRLGGAALVDWPFMALAGVLLSLGFGLVLACLGVTLWHARPLEGAARVLPVVLSALAATLTLGVIFTAGHAGVALPGLLSAIFSGGVALHAATGIAGWLTLGLIGVSYRLLPMFLLAPEASGAAMQRLLRVSVLALVLAVGGGLVMLAQGQPVHGALAAAGVAALAVLLPYARQVHRFYRDRKRRRLELNTAMVLPAFASLMAGLGLLIGAAARDWPEPMLAAAVFLLLFGWLSGFALAMLYKITAFITWLEVFGPHLGKASVPRVQDLVNEPLARLWFAGYHFGVGLGGAALLFSEPVLARIAAGVLLAMVAAITREILCIRALREIRDRAGAGWRRPPFFFSDIQPKLESKT